MPDAVLFNVNDLNIFYCFCKKPQVLFKTKRHEYTGSGRSTPTACGWEGNKRRAIIYRFNLNISSKMSYGMLEYDIFMSQNYMLMIL